MGYKVAIVGATGNVGRAMLEILAERQFPADEVVPLASRRSLGVEVSYGDKTLTTKALDHYDFSDVDICLMSAGGSVSKEWSPRIAAAGAVVIGEGPETPPPGSGVGSSSALVVAMVGTLWKITRAHLRARTPSGIFSAGLLSMFVANLGSLAVSGQILADSFVVIFIGALVGIVLGFRRPQFMPAEITARLANEDDPEAGYRGRSTRPAV